ncbi:MAG: DNA polymerase IV [bacterium]
MRRMGLSDGLWRVARPINLVAECSSRHLRAGESIKCVARIARRRSAIVILHIDMDAFYASVEEREQPALRGRPLAVGGRPAARGVVAAANYAAREYGVRSAMPSATALRLCPQLILLPPRGSFYAEVSAQIRAIFNRYTPVIEMLSLDEAFLDPRGSERLHGDAERIGHSIKRDIGDELRLIASVGVAPNKFLAKLASGHDKPDGFTVIQPQQAQDFLDALPVERLWGVGQAAAARLHRAGIRRVSQLRRASKARLQAEFGQHGERLWQLAHGVDAREVIADSEVKSISQETTFAEDIADLAILQSCALELIEGVGFRLRQAGLRGRRVHLKIRFDDFATITRARSLPAPTDSTDELWRVADALLRKALTARNFSVRLIGVGAGDFTRGAPEQADLFKPDGDAKQKALDALTDRIQRRYGKDAVRRGKSLHS